MVAIPQKVTPTNSTLEWYNSIKEHLPNGFTGTGFFIFFLKIFLFERESTSWGEGQKEKEREKQTPGWAQSPTWGLTPVPEIKTWAEIKSQTLAWLSHPGMHHIW